MLTPSILSRSFTHSVPLPATHTETSFNSVLTPKDTETTTPNGTLGQIAISQGQPPELPIPSGRFKRPAIDDSVIDYRTHDNGQTSAEPTHERNRYLDRIYADAHRSIAGTKNGRSDYHLIVNNENDFLKSSLRLHDPKAGSIETSVISPNSNHLNHTTVSSVKQYMAQNKEIFEKILSVSERKNLSDILYYEQTHNGNNAAMLSDVMRVLMLAVAEHKSKNLAYIDFDKSREFSDLKSPQTINIGALNQSIFRSQNYEFIDGQLTRVACNDFMAYAKNKNIRFYGYLRFILSEIKKINQEESFSLARILNKSHRDKNFRVNLTMQTTGPLASKKFTENAMIPTIEIFNTTKAKHQIFRDKISTSLLNASNKIIKQAAAQTSNITEEHIASIFQRNTARLYSSYQFEASKKNAYPDKSPQSVTLLLPEKVTISTDALLAWGKALTVAARKTPTQDLSWF